MIKQFKLNPKYYDKWIYQNGGVVDDILEGTLLDNVVVFCRRGVAVLIETVVNANMSEYTVYFAEWSNDAAVTTLNYRWHEFADAVGVE